MKTAILACMLAYFAVAGAQAQYTSLDKADKTTESILITGQRDMARFMRKYDRYELCNALKIDAYSMNKVELGEAISFVAGKKGITSLHIRYAHYDSLDMTQLSKACQLESLYLENDFHTYTSLDALASLKNLDKLGLYIENADEFPLTATRLSSLSVIDLVSAKHNPAMETDLSFYYRLNDSLHSYVEINSYADEIDLYNEATKKYFLSLWPEAEEKKPAVVMAETQVPAKYKTQDDIAYYKPIPALNPLDKNEKPDFEQTLIDPTIENTLVMDDQTVIDIPADAFVGKDGKPVTENVNILYRSVRTPAEMLSSGLTMFYDTAGKKEMFKSNGMFELRAYSGGEQLALKSDKSIDVNFSAKQDSSNYNLYSLDDKTGKWNFSVPLPQPSPLFSQPGIASQTTQSAAGVTRIAYMKDKTDFESRYENLAYTYLLPAGMNEGEVRVPYPSIRKKNVYWYMGYFEISGKNKKRKYAPINPRRSLVKIKVDYEGSKLYKQKVFFYLLNSMGSNGISTTEKYFPELKPFLNFRFEFDGEIKVAEFNKQYKHKMVYNDMRIYYDSGAQNAVIELKCAKGFVQIPVKASKTTRLGRTVINKAFVKAYDKYKKFLLQKEIRFNQTIRMVSRSLYRAYDSTVYFQSMPPLDPKSKNVPTIIAGLNINTGIGATTYISNSTYKINIKVLGFFNCDQLYRLKNPVCLIDPVFVCNDTSFDDIVTAYVVDRRARGTYTFSANNITLDPETATGIIAVDSKGQVYTCKGDKLRENINSKSGNKAQVIPLEKMPLSKSAEHVIQKLGS